VPKTPKSNMEIGRIAAAKIYKKNAGKADKMDHHQRFEACKEEISKLTPVVDRMSASILCVGQMNAMKTRRFRAKALKSKQK